MLRFLLVLVLLPGVLGSELFVGGDGEVCLGGGVFCPGGSGGVTPSVVGVGGSGGSFHGGRLYDVSVGVVNPNVFAGGRVRAVVNISLLSPSVASGEGVLTYWLENDRGDRLANVSEVFGDGSREVVVRYGVPLGAEGRWFFVVVWDADGISGVSTQDSFSVFPWWVFVSVVLVLLCVVGGWLLFGRRKEEKE